ncbi:MAG: bis(5'-nucleosyl)-tetraphosphatase (symmetrical) YqeK [Dethiobacteria bacterium]|jgi:predicted HD superfamily hydrolase involved in NAD metabolism
MAMNNVRKLLQRRAGGRLFNHSRGVEECACRLARVYGVDETKASLAGLLHDYGKIYPEKVLRQVALEHSLGDGLIFQEPKLLHAPVGAWLVRHELGIEDEEVLAAIRVHTTGAAGISLLARIVYLADYIEPGRVYPGVDDLRKTAFENLNQALLNALERTIKHILEKKKVLHPDSIAFRNSLILS